MHWLIPYGLGVGTIALVRSAGPAIGRAVRPVVREVIKGGIVVGGEIQRVTEEARASIDDLAAEARQEAEQGPRETDGKRA